MRGKEQKYLIILVTTSIAIAVGLYLFVTEGNTHFHGNLRMNKIARLLEKSPSLIGRYGASCTVKRLEKGLQMAAVLHGEFYHSTMFEVTTSTGPEIIVVNWSSGGKGLGVALSGFRELDLHEREYVKERFSIEGGKE